MMWAGQLRLGVRAREWQRRARDRAEDALPLILEAGRRELVEQRQGAVEFRRRRYRGHRRIRDRDSFGG